MCSNKMLHSDTSGYIMHCRKCDHIQVGFGNFALALSEAKFYDLAQSVSEYYSCKQNCRCREKKSIYLQSPAQNMALVFSVNELAQLDDLLQSAVLELELEKMLSENNISTLTT